MAFTVEALPGIRAKFSTSYMCKKLYLFLSILAEYQRFEILIFIAGGKSLCQMWYLSIFIKQTQDTE